MNLGPLALRFWWPLRYWSLCCRTGGARWTLVVTVGPFAIMWAR